MRCSAPKRRARAGGFGDFDEIVILEPSVDELERLLAELADPRLDYLLGELPVLPLPDRTVDRVIGARTAIRRSRASFGRPGSMRQGAK